MSTSSRWWVTGVGVMGAALALLPSGASAGSPPSGQVPGVSPVAQTLDSIQRIPVVSQSLNLFSDVAGTAGGTVWGTLNLITASQIPRPSDSPIQLSSNYSELINSSTSAESGAAAQGTGRLEVVGTRVAKDGRSVRIKVACVGGSAGCDGVVRVARRRHRHRVVVSKHVRLASGATAKYTLGA